MARPGLEVADIFRNHGAAWRQANAAHVSLGQMKVISAIESCRTAALGGHVVRCEDCSHVRNGNTPSETTVRISPFPRGPARRTLRQINQQAGAVDPPARAKATDPGGRMNRDKEVP